MLFIEVEGIFMYLYVEKENLMRILLCSSLLMWEVEDWGWKRLIFLEDLCNLCLCVIEFKKFGC